MVWHRQHLLQVLCQQRDQQRLHQFRGLEQPEKNDHGSFCWLHNRRKTNICIILCTRPADRLLCYWLAACLWPGSCPRFSWEFDFSLLDRFPGASKDKRLSSVFRSMQSFYRRYSVDNRLDTLTMGMLRKTDKKQTKSQLPSLEHLLEKPEALLDKSNTFENTIFQATLQMNACYSLLSRDLWNPQELATAGQRFLLLYVSLSDSDPEGMFWRFKPKHHLFQELCEFDECCPWIGHIEMKIWVGQWLLFQEEGVENLVCHLVFACFCFPLLHSNLVWCHMISHIWGKYHCFNFRKYIVQIHVSTRTSRVACCMKRKKRDSCQADTSTHLFFVHLFSHDLSPRRYLLHLGFFKDMEIKFPERKISTRRKESLLRGWFL